MRVPCIFKPGDDINAMRRAYVDSLNAPDPNYGSGKRRPIFRKVYSGPGYPTLKPVMNHTQPNPNWRTPKSGSRIGAGFINGQTFCDYYYSKKGRSRIVRVWADGTREDVTPPNPLLGDN